MNKIVLGLLAAIIIMCTVIAHDKMDTVPAKHVEISNTQVLETLSPTATPCYTATPEPTLTPTVAPTHIPSSVNIDKRKTLNSRGTRRPFLATAYDLSVASCGKPIGHVDYGRTASGIVIANKTLESARMMAVDPNIIPLGSQMYVEFPKPYEHYTGIYTAGDTGGAIKGYRVDLFYGDFKNNRNNHTTLQFGRQTVYITILK